MAEHPTGALTTITAAAPAHDLQISFETASMITNSNGLPRLAPAHEFEAEWSTPHCGKL
jgi:hypothetical protein